MFRNYINGKRDFADPNIFGKTSVAQQHGAATKSAAASAGPDQQNLATTGLALQNKDATVSNAPDRISTGDFSPDSISTAGISTNRILPRRIWASDISIDRLPAGRILSGRIIPVPVPPTYATAAALTAPDQQNLATTGLALQNKDAIVRNAANRSSTGDISMDRIPTGLISSGCISSAVPLPSTAAREFLEPNQLQRKPINHFLKHRLQNIWTIWYLQTDKTKSWEELQNEVADIDTIAKFWCVYSHIKVPSELQVGNDYSLFKKGIRPMWEDAANKNGGRWVITIKKISKCDLDNYWMNVLLCLITESFKYSEDICGAVVSIRNKSNKISIWTANSKNEEAVLNTGYKLRDLLKNVPPKKLIYQPNENAMATQSGANSFKPIYTI